MVLSTQNSWLTRFKIHHNISHALLCRENDCVDKEVVESWKSRLPNITVSYATCDLINMDESGNFFQASPDKTLKEKETECKKEKG